MKKVTEDLLYFKYDNNEMHRNEINRIIGAYVDIANGIVVDVPKRCHCIVGDPMLKSYILDKLTPFAKDGWITIID